MQAGDIVARYRNVISGIYKQYLAETTPEDHDEIAQGMQEIRRGTRWYQLATDEQVREIWATVRGSTVLLDYVITGTAQFKLLSQDHDQQWKTMIGQVVNSLKWVSTDPFVDVSLKERAPEGEWLQGVFEKTDWLIFLYLHTTVPQK